jgi:hypothetical protein
MIKENGGGYVIMIRNINLEKYDFASPPEYSSGPDYGLASKIIIA